MGNTYGSGLRSECDGSPIPDYLVDYLDAAQSGARQYAYLDPETRRRLHREDVTVRALVTVAGRCGDVELAAFPVVEHRGTGDEDEADRITREHGFDPHRLAALRSLARSRGVGLDVVLRAALRGDLASVVRQQPVRHGQK